MSHRVIRYWRGRAIWVICVAVLVMPAPLAAQQGARLNYVNADLGDVIRSLAAILGVNVLLTEDVPTKRVTYTTQRTVPTDQVGAVLEAILESQGLVLVQRGPVGEVMPQANAPRTGPVAFGKELPRPPPLGLITQIVPLEFIRAEEGLDMLTQVAGPLAHIDLVPRSNAVLITDLSSNVARYLELLRGLDVRSDGEAGLRTFVVRLKHANAGELALTLAQIFGASVPATLPERARVRALEDRSLSRTLEGFRERELQALDMRRATPIPLAVQPSADTTSEASAARGAVSLTTIVPEPATNSLVLRTSPPNFLLLKETIDALDVRPAQVLLEVHIAEITLDRANEFGINWSIFSEGSDADVTARFGLPAFSDSALAGVGDGLLRLVRLNTVDVRAVLRALASQTDVRVLSNPRILALNNEQARILVGSQVPFNQSTRTGLDVVVDRVVQYRDVGTQLTVLPTINDDGYVTFRILQEVSNLTNQTLEAALDAPIITSREAETSAIVRNGQTIVIGGLIDRTSSVIERGIPLLKDIPILGFLFKSRSTQRFTTELAIFLTPYVVYTDEEAQELFERERARIEPLLDDSERPAADTLPAAIPSPQPRLVPTPSP